MHDLFSAFCYGFSGGMLAFLIGTYVYRLNFKRDIKEYSMTLSEIRKQGTINALQAEIIMIKKDIERIKNGIK